MRLLQQLRAILEQEAAMQEKARGITSTQTNPLTEHTNNGAMRTKKFYHSSKDKPSVTIPATHTTGTTGTYQLSTNAAGLVHGNSIEHTAASTHCFHNLPEPSEWKLPLSLVKIGDKTWAIDDTDDANTTQFPAFLQYQTVPAKKEQKSLASNEQTTSAKKEPTNTMIVLWRWSEHDTLPKIFDQTTQYFVPKAILGSALTAQFGERCTQAILKHADYEQHSQPRRRNITGENFNPAIVLDTYHFSLGRLIDAINDATNTADEKAILARLHIDALKQVEALSKTPGQFSLNDILIRCKFDKDSIIVERVMIADPNTLAFATHTSEHPHCNQLITPTAASPLMPAINASIEQHPINKEQKIIRDEDLDRWILEQEPSTTPFSAELVGQAILIALQARTEKRTNSHFYTTKLEHFSKDFLQLYQAGDFKGALELFKKTLPGFTDTSAKVFEEHRLITITGKSRSLTKLVTDALATTTSKPARSPAP